MAKLNPKNYAEILFGLLEKDRPESESGKVANIFFEYLIRENKITKFSEILKEYNKFVDQKNGMNEVEVISSSELDENVAQSLKDVLGQKSKFVFKIDKEIIGGIVVKIDNKVIDASLLQQIKKLKTHLS